MRDTILHIDCKIDFRSLGVNPDKLTEDEKIEYGSKFAFGRQALMAPKEENLKDLTM